MTKSRSTRRPARYFGPAGPLGCHVGIGGGVDKAPARGRDLGARAIQIFVRSPRMWKFPPLDQDTADAFREQIVSQEIVAAVAHSMYLINLGSQKDDLWQKGIDALADEVERCALLGVDRLVLHPGSAGDAGEKAGLRRIRDALNRVVRRTADCPVTLLLEITAGSGAHLGASVDQLAWLIDHHRQPERLGICLDTAHALAAGYPLHEKRGLRELIDEVEKKIGLEKLGCFHLNDSLKPYASRRDRHARIGQGELGEAFFARLLADNRLHGIPKILEVPGGDEAFREDLRLLARLAR